MPVHNRLFFVHHFIYHHSVIGPSALLLSADLLVNSLQHSLRGSGKHRPSTFFTLLIHQLSFSPAPYQLSPSLDTTLPSNSRLPDPSRLSWQASPYCCLFETSAKVSKPPPRPTRIHPPYTSFFLIAFSIAIASNFLSLWAPFPRSRARGQPSPFPPPSIKTIVPHSHQHSDIIQFHLASFISLGSCKSQSIPVAFHCES